VYGYGCMGLWVYGCMGYGTQVGANAVDASDHNKNMNPYAHTPMHLGGHGDLQKLHPGPLRCGRGGSEAHTRALAAMRGDYDLVVYTMGVWVYGCMGVWVYGCMGVWVYGCIIVWGMVCGCMGVWAYGCMSAWVYGCMGVYMSIRRDCGVVA